jgi:hypothetical protein
VGEVQRPLNQKLGSKPLRAIDFVLRFVLSIKSKFKKFILSIVITNLDVKSMALKGFELNFWFKGF